MPATPWISTPFSTVGLESSPVAAALAGLRAHEARYFKNKYDHVFTVEPASNAKATIDWVHRILKEESDIVISSRPLEAPATTPTGSWCKFPMTKAPRLANLNVTTILSCSNRLYRIRLKV